MKKMNLLAMILAGGLAVGASASLTLAQTDKSTTGAKHVQPKDDKTAHHKDKGEAKGEAKIGEKAPAFTLTDTDGKTVNLADYTKEKKIVVIEWFNPECPFVKMHYENGASTMTSLAKEYKDKNVVWLTISSGATKEELAAAKKDWKIDGPVLMDADSKVAASYGSKNTPTMFVIAADGTLAYRGAIDDADLNTMKPGKTNYVKTALDQVIKGETVTTPEKKAYGCRVKPAKG